MTGPQIKKADLSIPRVPKFKDTTGGEFRV